MVIADAESAAQDKKKTEKKKDQKKPAKKKPAADDETTYSDLEITVEMQNRGFRLASTQDGLFFTKK